MINSSMPLIDIRVKKPELDTKHVKSYSLFWTFVGAFSILITILVTTCVMLQPFDKNLVSESSTLGFWHIAENTPSLSLLFYLSISGLGLLFTLIVIICAIDQRIFRFRFSAPFMRIAFTASIWNIILIIAGVANQPLTSGDNFVNMIWNYGNGHHMMSSGGVVLLVFALLFFIYFILELVIGVIHENKIFSKLEKIETKDPIELRNIFNGYIDSLTIFYAYLFGFVKKIYKTPRYKQHLIKWHLINKYIIFNFFFSLLFTFCFIYIIVFGCSFSSTNPYDAPKWFVPTIIFFFCLFLLITFTILNVVHTLKKMRVIDRTANQRTHLYYGISLFVPWVGLCFEFYTRYHIKDDLKQLAVEKKVKHKAIVITFNSLKVLVCVMLGVVALPCGFVAATLMSKYNPPANKTEFLNVDDTRSDETKNNDKGITIDNSDPGNRVWHSALTSNVGFCAYNQDMHFFADEPGHFLNGQSWAADTMAIKQSLNGLARTVGMYHDTNYDGHFWKYNWDNYRSDASNLRGVRAIWESKFNDTNSIDVNKDTRWDKDELIFGPEQSLNPFDDGDYKDEELGTKNGLYDFISVEELDRDSTRSYHVDEYNSFRNSEIWTNDGGDSHVDEVKDYYASSYAYNYVVPFVPVPLNQPHGKVMGGLTTLSRYHTNDSTSERYALTSIPGIYGLFQLRRCLIINKIPVIDNAGNAIWADKDGKITTDESKKDHKIHFTYITGHLDAYDNGGEIRRLQLKAVNNIFENELFNHDANGSRTTPTGNYALMGADWNLTLPDTKGYEGSEIDNVYDPSDDPAITPFNWRSYNHKADPINSNNPDNWTSYEVYNPSKQYAKGDIVQYQCPYDATKATTNEDINTVNGIDDATSKEETSKSTYTNFNSTNPEHGTALYEAYENVPPGQHPSISDNNGGFIKNDMYWKYYVNPIYKGTSINKSTRSKYLSVSEPNKPTLSNQTSNYDNFRIANFYGNHAVPSSRNAGVRYYGNNDHISELSDLTQTKHSIDGFLASYNIKVDGTFSYDNNFVYSDHMPVSIKFYLNA